MSGYLLLSLVTALSATESLGSSDLFCSSLDIVLSAGLISVHRKVFVRFLSKMDCTVIRGRLVFLCGFGALLDYYFHFYVIKGLGRAADMGMSPEIKQIHMFKTYETSLLAASRECLQAR